ncbi:hypothetical protein [Streptomyces sp. NPDC048002]|uniref:hypothetical protein n=1 Tax=Streptomyces sp. NPDC048002 TaxID=3154344 RepID=UPI0033DB49BF
MSDAVRAADDETGRRRSRSPVLLSVGIGCYVLAVIAGMYVLADHTGLVVQIPLWAVHAVLLVLLIRRLGAKESSTYAALTVVILSAMSMVVADLARDDLTLQQRGEQVAVTVVSERLDPAEGRKGRHSYYTLEHEDGTRVPGPEMETTSDLYDVGQELTVVEDPEGELRPRTPGEADATGEALGSGALALGALGSVAWMTWRGSDAARRRDERGKQGPGAGKKAYKAVVGDHSTREEQEEKLREALRTHPADRRGYIKVLPEEYPDLTHGRAARVAWETGLKAEAVGNRGSWRFKETVIEAVPHD